MLKKKMKKWRKFKNKVLLLKFDCCMNRIMYLKYMIKQAVKLNLEYSNPNLLIPL